MGSPGLCHRGEVTVAWAQHIVLALGQAQQARGRGLGLHRLPRTPRTSSRAPSTCLPHSPATIGPEVPSHGQRLTLRNPRTPCGPLQRGTRVPANPTPRVVPVCECQPEGDRTAEKRPDLQPGARPAGGSLSHAPPSPRCTPHGGTSAPRPPTPATACGSAVRLGF